MAERQRSVVTETRWSKPMNKIDTKSKIETVTSDVNQDQHRLHDAELEQVTGGAVPAVSEIVVTKDLDCASTNLMRGR